MVACSECGYPVMLEADWAIWCPCCGHHDYLEDLSTQLRVWGKGWSSRLHTRTFRARRALALEAAKYMNSYVQ